MIYTVTFNPALDYVLKVNNLELGETNRSFYEEIHIGGKGINVSLVLSSFGVENTALGFIGGFTEDKLLKFAEEKDIKTDFVKLKDGDTRINVKIKSLKETEINAEGPNIEQEELNDFFSKLSEISSGDTIVLSGSIPKSLPDNIYEQIMEKLAEKNIRICVDATGKLLLNCLKYKPFVIKPNIAELEEISGEKLDNDEKIVSAAKKLQIMGAVNVLVSMGADGAMLLDEYSNIHKIKAHKIVPLDTVGAGDSMLAGFIIGIEKGYDYALKLGNAAGAATSCCEGIAKREEILSFM